MPRLRVYPPARHEWGGMVHGDTVHRRRSVPETWRTGDAAWQRRGVVETWHATSLPELY